LNFTSPAPTFSLTISGPPIVLWQEFFVYFQTVYVCAKSMTEFKTD
jgi:hypothetical protein